MNVRQSRICFLIALIVALPLSFQLGVADEQAAIAVTITDALIVATQDSAPEVRKASFSYLASQEKIEAIIAAFRRGVDDYVSRQS